MRRIACLLLGALGVAGSLAARADGAFPDELQVFAPASSPQRLVLGTNYGAVQSSDDGQTWTLVCEGLISGTQLVTMYQLGPDGSLFAIYTNTVTHSADQGCTWTPSAPLVGSLTQDLFVDPVDGNHVWVIADGFQAGVPNALYLSTDGGLAFGAPSIEESAGYLNGIEASHTEGVALASGFLNSTDGGSNIPYLLETSDLGSAWTQHLHADIEPRIVGIAQVDPANDERAYLRLSGTGLDALAITEDRGATVQVLLELNDVMSAFALGGDGTLYVGAKSGHLWVRAPGATAFTLGSAPSIRCLAERAGTLYACGDDVLDGFALAASTDRGATFHGILRTQDISTLAACEPVQRQCTVPLQMLQAIIDSVVPTEDAGSTTGGTPPSGTKGGCSCGESDALGLAGLLALAACRRRRVRKAGGDESSCYRQR